MMGTPGINSVRSGKWKDLWAHSFERSVDEGSVRALSQTFAHAKI